MDQFPVVQSYSYLLAHVPEFVRYGSKPKREIKYNPELGSAIDAHLRSFEEAVSYPPNQVFLGNLHPEDLVKRPEPWWQNPVAGASPNGAYGPFLNQLEFYGFLKLLDQFNLVWFTPEFTGQIRKALETHPLLYDGDLGKLGDGTPMNITKNAIENNGALPLYLQNELIGSFQRDHDDDESLQADVLLENLVTKASGVLAVRQLLQRASIKPEAVDFIMSCSEEAIGDRYQRGGGNLAKAVGEECKLLNATGSDVKVFCAGPVYAIVHAASLVKAETFDTVIVFGGGCQTKLGMKFQGHLKKEMPILEDVLGSMAYLTTKDDSISPIIRLDSVGKHTIGEGSSQQDIMTSLVIRLSYRLVVVGTANFSMNTTVYATSTIMKIIKGYGRIVKNAAIFWAKSNSNWNQKIQLTLLSSNDHSEQINQDQPGLKIGLNPEQKN